jgi:hypothetical protein
VSGEVGAFHIYLPQPDCQDEVACSAQGAGLKLAQLAASNCSPVSGTKGATQCNSTNGCACSVGQCRIYLSGRQIIGVATRISGEVGSRFY